MPEMEKKEYEVKGTVTISSEEYRDILDNICELKIYAQREHDDWSKEYSRANELKREIEKLNKKIEELNEWFDDTPEAKQMFKEWRLEQLAKESEEDDE